MGGGLNSSTRTKRHEKDKMRKAFSHVLGMTLGLLALLPPFCNDVPNFYFTNTITSNWNMSLGVLVNSFHWVFAVIFIGLLCIHLCFLNIHKIVKIFAIYLYFTCYFSKAPYISFNAMLLIVPAIYLYALIKNFGDKKILINWIVSIFWFEVAVCGLQFMGKDVLINFNRPQQIFLGTVMQHMRMGSLFAILSPFLFIRSRFYIIPLTIVAFLVYSSSFALALFAGAFVFFLLSDTPKKIKKYALISLVVLALGHSFYNITSFRVAFTCGRIPVWGKIFMTGLGATYTGGLAVWGDIQAGLTRSFIGHGLNLFPVLYPALIGDANPFAQCHNDWLQLFWEVGWFGLVLPIIYCIDSIYKLYKKHEIVWIAGIVIIGVNMFFAFPVFMPPQTPLLVLTFFALCEQTIGEKNGSNIINNLQ